MERRPEVGNGTAGRLDNADPVDNRGAYAGTAKPQARLVHHVLLVPIRCIYRHHMDPGQTLHAATSWMGVLAVSKASELKALKTRRDALYQQNLQLKEQVVEAQRLQSATQHKLQAVDKQIADLVEAEPVVSEHAILRFLQRGIGIDMDDVRNEIMTPNVRAVATNNGSGRVPISKGCTALVKKGVVTTVVGGEFQDDE